MNDKEKFSFTNKKIFCKNKKRSYENIDRSRKTGI